MNINRKIAGPSKPIVVINRLTDKTVQLPIISESAKCPATEFNVFYLLIFFLNI